MQQLPGALAALAAYRQFLLYKLVWDAVKQGYRKIPINPHTFMSYPKGGDWQKDPANMTDHETAIALASAAGPDYGVGFLFTPSDPFYFLDIDSCLNADNATWSPVAMTLMGLLPGAAVEVSQSGRGLHIFGAGTVPEHGNKNTALGIELYTEWRFAALTGTNIIGDIATDCSAGLAQTVAHYFTKGVALGSDEWTNEPVAEWNGPEDDDELIEKMVGSQSAGGVFGGRSSFAALWGGDEDSLARSYPDPGGQGRPYGESEADAALAQHLAFWTGKDCDRMLRLMWRSGLVRDKWEREDYLVRTISRAVSLQESVYTAGHTEADNSIADAHGAPKLRASSDAQRNYAETVRALKLAEATDDQARRLCTSSGANASAKFWLDNQEAAVDELVAMVTPIDSAADPLGSAETGPQIVAGHQYLGATLQLEHFAGCVYIQDLHRVFTPSGTLLKVEQFNATYGGYVFQLDETGDKTTRKAWEAFTESQVIRWPKAEATCFRPEMATGAMLQEEGRVLVNTYVPIETPRQQGDPAPFLTHLAKVLPEQQDRDILLAYMAACVQHKGAKFQWAPLLQGCEGNGKTLFTRCVAFAIGNRYTHLPPANEISEKFNEWLFNKIFIGIEDVYVPDHKKEVIEVLKPMITNDRLAMRAMQQSQVMGDNRANFMLNSNHKDAIRKTRTDRRFAVFYTSQQDETDLIRDSMTGDYFPDLYKWLREGGYAVVAHYLETYAIPDQLNPATKCHRAPVTTSTDEAINASMGGVEQEILEAVEEGRPGFAGGWISSVAVERLLNDMRAGRAIPPNKRRDLLVSLGYDWHPALTDGRANNPIAIDEGKKPRLFIREGHISANLSSPAEVARVYQEAQGVPASAAGAASHVFGGS